MLSPSSAIARALRSIVPNKKDCTGVRFPRTVISNSPRRGENGWRRRVGKGARQARTRLQVRKHSAVPTRLRLKHVPQDRVGTAYDRPCRHGNALQAPLPTLQFAAQPLSQILLQEREHLAPAVERL